MKMISIMMGLFIATVFGMVGCSGGGASSGSSTNTPTTPSVSNTAPIANAGVSQSVVTGAVVTLDGSASSDSSSGNLTYNWLFTSKPSESSATLSNVNAIKPTFSPDLNGSYVLSLIVNDGNMNSTAAIVTVTASNTAGAITFNTLYNSFKTFATTGVFEGLTTTGLNSQQSYTTISNLSTYNGTSVIYNTSTQHATISFYTGCRIGDNGEPCSPQNGIVMYEVASPTANNTGYRTYYYLNISNYPLNGIQVSVSPSDVNDLTSNSPLIMADFKLNSTSTIYENTISSLLPTLYYTIKTGSGFTYNYTYLTINAIISKLSFISRTTGNTLATYSF